MRWNLNEIKTRLNTLARRSGAEEQTPDTKESESTEQTNRPLTKRISEQFKNATEKLSGYSRAAGEKADVVADTVAEKLTELTGRETTSEEVKKVAKKAAVIGAVIGTGMAAQPLINRAMQAQRIQRRASQGASGFFPGMQRDMSAEWEADDLEYDRQYHDNIEDQYNYNDQLDNFAADQIDYNMGMDGF